MRVTVSGEEYIDLDEIAKLWGFASGKTVTSSIYYARRKRRDLPLFPENDLIIDQKFFWKADRIPQIMAWRHRYVKGY